MTSTGQSLMPEGFEKTITKQDMADLIAFIAEHTVIEIFKPASIRIARGRSTLELYPGSSSPMMIRLR